MKFASVARNRIRMRISYYLYFLSSSTDLSFLSIKRFVHVSLVKCRFSKVAYVYEILSFIRLYLKTIHSTLDLNLTNKI